MDVHFGNSRFAITVSAEMKIFVYASLCAHKYQGRISNSVINAIVSLIDTALNLVYFKESVSL